MLTHQTAFACRRAGKDPGRVPGTLLKSQKEAEVQSGSGQGAGREQEGLESIHSEEKLAKESFRREAFESIWKSIWKSTRKSNEQEALGCWSITSSMFDQSTEMAVCII